MCGTRRCDTTARPDCQSPSCQSPTCAWNWGGSIGAPSYGGERCQAVSSEVDRNTALVQEEAHVQVDTVAWVTRYVGGSGSDRVGFDLVLAPGDTVRTVLRRLSQRFPQLQQALWDPASGELGEHIEVVVNGAILGVRNGLDSVIKAADS